MSESPRDELLVGILFVAFGLAYREPGLTRLVAGVGLLVGLGAYLASLVDATDSNRTPTETE